MVLSSVKISKESAEMKVGETLQLDFTYEPSELERPYHQWTTSDADVATVDKNGLVTALSEGDVVISVLSSAGTKKLSDECTITITNVEATSVKLSKTEHTMKVGDKFELTCTIEPGNTTDKTVTWVSDNEKVAVVKDGKVEALGVGEARITAIVNDVKSGACRVHVDPLEVKDITLSAKTIAIEERRSYTLKATIYPDLATDKTLTWHSSDESVATVSEGVVTAKRIGTCTVSATSSDGRVTAECAVEVIPVKVSGIQIGEIGTMVVGQKVQLSYHVTPDDAANKNVSIASKDQAVASVEDGYIIANGLGATEIVITTEDGTYSASIPVVVTDITSMISLGMSFSGANIMGYHTGRLFSSITNGSGQRITLTRFELRDSSTGALVVYSDDPSQLGVLSSGASRSLGSNSINGVYYPMAVWYFTCNGREYVVSQTMN